MTTYYVPTASGSTAPAPTPSGSMTQSQQSAFDYMRSILDQYNLGSLANVLQGIVVGGDTDPAQITLKLQDTQEWKTRFAGNEMLKQKNLPVLSIAEYLSAEQSYAQALKQYGLPEGFYDDHDDFAKWIGNAVSPNELMQRAQVYSDIAKRTTDPAVQQQLQSMGFSDGDILAFVMDPGRAQPLVQQKYQTTLLGAAARRAGITSDNTYLSQLADRGVSEQQATQGFGLISENISSLSTLAQVYGVDYSQHDFETEVFDSNGQAAAKRKRLASQERAAFGGSSGVTKGSLTQNTAGQY